MRHADCVEVYREAKRFSSNKTIEFRPQYGATPLYEHHNSSLVFNDPPLHTRVRQLIMGALTLRTVEAMEPALTPLVDHLLDAAAAKDDCDRIEDFAAANPLEVIGNLLAMPDGDRTPSRLVGSHSCGASAGVDLSSVRARQPCTRRVHHLSSRTRCRPAPEFRQFLEGHIDAPDPRREWRRPIERNGDAARLYLHSQCRARNDHQPDRQRFARADQVGIRTAAPDQ